MAVLFAGCVLRKVDPYPADWPARAAGDDCRAVLGVYDNLGPKPGLPLFALLVSAYDGTTTRRAGDAQAGAVNLSMPEAGVLEARTRQLSQRFLAEKNEFGCAGGVLELWGTSGGAGNVGGYFGSTVVRVTRDADGWLVVSSDETGFGLLAYVIPVYMSGVSWYRFRPASP